MWFFTLYGSTLGSLPILTVRAFSAYEEESNSTIYVSKEEKRLLMKAAFRAYIPKLLIVLLGFGLAIILIYFWLM